MDFNDSAQEAAFREEVRNWLKDNVPTDDELSGLDYIGRAKLWQKRKYDAGWACIRWPEEHGGQVQYTRQHLQYWTRNVWANDDGVGSG
jgi:alkylation response protein AidB-like acyl-CoA dehydrogenase